jgi:type III pantothenate kinase
MEIAGNLVIDIGNTRCKAGLFDADILVEQWVFADKIQEKLSKIIERYKPVFSLISSVGEQTEPIKELLQKRTRFMELTPDLAVPFTNLYLTPKTLGMDRVAGIAGATHFFPDQACLVIDMGTCITYDFINTNKEYLGGAISPGVAMRLSAMAVFTKRLPEIVFHSPDSFIGNTTQSSMLSGVYYGILGEINDTISRYEEQFGEINVLICGGDAPLFDKHTKKSIFAAPDLVLHGLNKLLQYNAT